MPIKILQRDEAFQPEGPIALVGKYTDGYHVAYGEADLPRACRRHRIQLAKATERKAREKRVKIKRIQEKIDKPPESGKN